MMELTNGPHTVASYTPAMDELMRSGIAQLAEDLSEYIDVQVNLEAIILISPPPTRLTATSNAEIVAGRGIEVSPEVSAAFTTREQSAA
jgi:hypothetical protein